MHVAHGRRRVDRGGTALTGTNCLPAISLSTKCAKALSGASAGDEDANAATDRQGVCSRALGTKLSMG